MKRLKTPTQIDVLFRERIAILFKHSNRCNISETAYQEVSAFNVSNPQIPIYIVDVIEDQLTTRYVTERSSVEHQSPQVILLQEGRVVWHASHFDLAGEVLQAQVKACLSDLS